MSDIDNESGPSAEKRPRKPRGNPNESSAPESSAPAPAPEHAQAGNAPASGGDAHGGERQGGGQGDSGGGSDAGGNPAGAGGEEGGFQSRNRNRRDRFRDKRDRFRDRPRDGEGGGEEGGGNGNNGGGERNDRPMPQLPADFPVYSLNDLKRMPAHKLLEIAEKLNLHEGVARMRKQDVNFALLKVLTRHPAGVEGDGVLEILPDGYGFLRSDDASYLAGPDDVYISPSQIRRFNLRTGDHIAGRIRSPKDGERYVALNIVDTINGEPPEASKGKVLFENLTPLFPRERFRLERGNGSSEDITGRVMDLMSPLGKGQRALIVSPPKAGKTVLMQNVAQAIIH
ncbi:MAG: Rho termination factor N-terminal domain-containing protein, partial [Arenimonas sp.]|nr:Rho termination factor N-terminal domain-containing protein [Arenimonas sp.]